MNYWEFGDYIGIGAGAHSKITKNHSMERRIVISNPISYVEKIQSNNQFFKKLVIYLEQRFCSNTF